MAMGEKSCLFLFCGLALLAIGLSAPATPGAISNEDPARCRSQIAPQLAALDGLRARLLRHIDYRQYVEEVEAIRPIVARMPVDRMAVLCLGGAGRLTEETYNEYVYASLPWNECLADPRCDLEAVESAVKRKWWVAGLVLSRAHL